MAIKNDWALWKAWYRLVPFKYTVWLKPWRSERKRNSFLFKILSHQSTSWYPAGSCQRAVSSKLSRLARGFLPPSPMRPTSSVVCSSAFGDGAITFFHHIFVRDTNFSNLLCPIKFQLWLVLPYIINTTLWELVQCPHCFFPVGHHHLSLLGHLKPPVFPWVHLFPHWHLESYSTFLVTVLSLLCSVRHSKTSVMSSDIAFGFVWFSLIVKYFLTELISRSCHCKAVSTNRFFLFSGLDSISHIFVRKKFFLDCDFLIRPSNLTAMKTWQLGNSQRHNCNRAHEGPPIQFWQSYRMTVHGISPFYSSQ